MARVRGTGFLRPPLIAYGDAPPPGMVRLSVSVNVSEELLKDELALGAFLVRAAKKGLRK